MVPAAWPTAQCLARRVARTLAPRTPPLLHTVMPMASIAVARLTFANGIRQPMTWLVVALGVALIGLSYLFGMFSFEDSSRMRLLLTAGVATTVLLGCFLGVVTVAQAVHDELSSRTALTLFAKPIARESFLIGKVLGTIGVVGVVIVIIAAIHLGVVYMAQQTGFDWSERHRQYHDPSVVGYLPWGKTVVAHFLGFAANLTLICLAAALALKVPMAGTILCTFAVFVCSHVLATMGISSAVILPSLHIFNVDDALHFSDVDITSIYFILSLGHAVLFAAACMVVGMYTLRKQDIP